MAEEQGGLLLTGGRVYTADPDRPWVEAVLTRGATIAFVGDVATAREMANAGTEWIDLPGTLIVPGLNDSHIHTNWGGRALEMLDLDGVNTLAELQTALHDFATAHPERAWILGTGLAYEALDEEARPRLALDAVIAGRPIYIRALDWHSAWANTRALALGGVLDGADVPKPNEVVVDADGRANGFLREHLATELITNHIPKYTSEEEDASLINAFRYLNHYGITSVQNMHGDLGLVRRYQALWERGLQTVRALHCMRIDEPGQGERLPEFAALSKGHASGWNRIPGIKLFIDGVIEGKTAMLFDPYADGSGELGVPNWDLDIYRAIVCEADRLGMQVTTHAIGDRAVHTTLDAYEQAARQNGAGRDLRHRVEHIEVSHPADIPRFAALNVTASMQPLHAVPTTDPEHTAFSRLVGPARLPYVFRWRSLLETGARVSFGSDWPVVTPDPFKGLHAAVTRTSVAGLPEGGYQPQERVTLAQALDAYTIGAARAERQEQIKGRLRPGMLADIAVFSQDLFAREAGAILDTRTVLTVLDGQIVYRGEST